MSNPAISYSFPLKKITKIDMQKQRAMIKLILKLKSGNIAVGSYGAVISIWDPETKEFVQAWRAKGAVYDLIELDNNDLIACCFENGNYISIYKFDDEDEFIYENFDDIECEGSIISALVKLDKNKFLYGTMDNTIVFWTEEENGGYKKEKEIKLESKGDMDCIYSLIKISNGNFIATGFDLVKLINSEVTKVEKDIEFSQPSCSFEDSQKHIWIGNSPGSILVIDSDLNKLKEMKVHDSQINKFSEFDNHIISASTDFKMKVWDLNTYECLHTIEGYGEITAISLINENCLVTAQGIPQVEGTKHYKEKDLLQFLVYYESEKNE